MAPHDLASAQEPQAAGFSGFNGALSTALNPALNPKVDQLAQRLLLSAGREGAELDGNSWALIEEVLAFAAEAEQHISQQQKRIHHLESLSKTDELTGLANLRGLKRFLRRAIANARRYDEYGVVGYIDLDGFKEINDELGHAAGDEILRHVAGILKAKIRLTDMAARIGGDEFAVVLSRSDWGHGAARLVEFQRAINENPVELYGKRVIIRASMGLAPFGPTSNVKQLLAYADKAMYADKRARFLKSNGVEDISANGKKIAS